VFFKYDRAVLYIYHGNLSQKEENRIPQLLMDFDDDQVQVKNCHVLGLFDYLLSLFDQFHNQNIKDVLFLSVRSGLIELKSL
jgi:hypothetical protein